MYRGKNANPLIVLLRPDLGDPGRTIAQACHATHQFGQSHPEVQTTEYVYILKAKNSDLELWEEILSYEGEPHVLFREPDLNNEATALCCTIAPSRFKALKKF